MLRSAAAFSLVVLMTAPSMADDADDAIAKQLGMILASEDICNLSYKQEAIAAFIEANVAADDANFPGQLSGEMAMVNLLERKMTPSGKTARCAQVARLARNYKFID